MVKALAPAGAGLPEDSSPVARARRGKEARARTPRSSHGDWAPVASRPDPIDLLREQATTRVEGLVPIRHGRMGASAFAFFRGAAVVMASDLASSPNTGLDVQLCGDAHLANFGGFASPERSLVFDVNDFDETLPGPFEWDVKRLAASLEIAARARDFDDATRAKVVSGAMRSYRETIRKFAVMANLDVWYARLDLDAILRMWGQELGTAAIKRFQRTVDKAGSKDRLKAKAKLTELVDGELRFASDPPLLVPVRDLFSGADHQRLHDTIGAALASYRATLNGDRRHLLEGYRFVDLARKVVGVGSVGTRSWVALMEGRDDNDPLFLQVKQAQASVLEPHLGPSSYLNHAQRVVRGQYLMQAASDIFLGWTGLGTIDFYVRQLRDMKLSVSVESLGESHFVQYCELCGWALARAHARSGDPAQISGYLGLNDTFDRAIASFAETYADQTERDHAALLGAVQAGRIPIETGAKSR
ncbi:MAG TPA: DUF2252 domain-containing protein [Ktedonobacter sp.]|nr:DUF2252 domain-containing protein [Ktedonobacter sp.]